MGKQFNFIPWTSVVDGRYVHVNCRSLCTCTSWRSLCTCTLTLVVYMYVDGHCVHVRHDVPCVHVRWRLLCTCTLTVVVYMYVMTFVVYMYADVHCVHVRWRNQTRIPYSHHWCIKIKCVRACATVYDGWIALIMSLIRCWFVDISDRGSTLTLRWECTRNSSYHFVTLTHCSGLQWRDVW